MRRTLPLALSAVLAVAACQDVPSPAGPESDLPVGEAPAAGLQAVDVIVTLNPDFAPGGHEANQRAAGAVARSLGLNPVHTYGTALYGFSATVPAGRLNALQRDPRVAAVEVDQIATVVPGPGAAAPPPGKGPGGGGEDPGTGSSSQATPWGISRVNGVPGYSGTSVAWIIDSGIDLDHPDLNVDVGRSVNYAAGKSPDDGNGHGTHVAGTVAAINNNFGVIGVAPGATVVAVRVLGNSGSGSYSGVIAGVDYVANNAGEGDVANMSLGGPPSDALDNAVIAAAMKGVRFALAAGNERDDANNHSPARANHANIYTVSSFALGDKWSSFSNYGNPPVDYAAPGSSIQSTYKGGGYATLSGTSMAAPHVAGILLLGNVRNGGTVKGDPDGNADVIAVH